MNRQNKQHRKVRKWLAGPNFSGQHLLHNKKIVKEMIELAQIKKTDTVMDIGAGKGALTVDLSEKAGKVLAVEYDQIFVEALRRKMNGVVNTTVIHRDFLTIHLPNVPYCVVANIPYSITTDIMEKLLEPPANPLQRAVLMIEKGAAKRFTQNPITNPRILAWRMWFDLKLVKTVTRDSFSPPPRVDSAILRIRRKSMCPVDTHHYYRFLALAKYGLQYPQQPISEVLTNIFTMRQMTQLLRNMGVEREIPICSLKEHQWAFVFTTMIQHVEPFRWPKLQRKAKR